MSRRAKIVATLGPSTSSPDQIRRLVDAGVDVFRLNFAHATPDQHRIVAEAVRAQAAAAGKVVAVLADLPGPKMRTGPLQNEEVLLQVGQPFTLTAHEVPGDARVVSTNVDEDITSLAAPGDEVFLADGQIVLAVQTVDADGVHTAVVRGGVLRSRKGMHLPRAESKIRAFTEEDLVWLRFALEIDVDLVGLSFVRDASDVELVRAALPAEGHHPQLVAKVETRSACENLAGVIATADAVMVARGDLGIQTPLSELPVLQKEIIRACNDAGKPVITATQMLESMTRSPLPTRAEVADVANAVLDGTDAVMLSEETAVGAYPIETVTTMSKTIESAERSAAERPAHPRNHVSRDPVSWAVAAAAVQAADELRARAILCPTSSGATARRVAAFRPHASIVGLSRHRDAVGALALAWGVSPLVMQREASSATQLVNWSVETARAAGLLSPGDLVVVVAGGPEPRAGSTDFLRVVSVT